MSIDGPAAASASDPAAPSLADAPAELSAARKLIRRCALNSALLLVSLLLGLAVVEAGFRLLSGVPVLSGENFRNVHVIQILLTGASQYDPVLGWTMTPDFVSPNKPEWFSTGDHGIRTGLVLEKPVRTGGVLVVGSSFTAGSEVRNADTWPARLEAHLHQPVLNAGVGGYAADQVALRAEQLLPLVAPKVLVYEVMESSILWNSYSSAGRPKPYYTIENGRLALHNSPVPYGVLVGDRYAGLKTLLGYSLVLDRVMVGLAPTFWYGSAENQLARVQTDEVEVTCRLLARLRARTDQLGVRLVLLGHAAGSDVIQGEKQPPNIALVEECAREMRIEVVDAFAPLRALYNSDRERFTSLYMMHGELFGHMSPAGNEQIAELLAAALAQPVPARQPVEPTSPEPDAGGGAREAISLGPIAQFFPATPVAAMDPVAGAPENATEFRITAIGDTGEHYVAGTVPHVEAGRYQLSFEVLPEKSSTMRAQLIGEETTGMVCDVEFRRNMTSTARLGKARQLTAAVEPTGKGWYRVSLGGTIPSGALSLIIQLTKSEDQPSFAPHGETIRVRAVRLERTGSAHPNRPIDASTGTSH